MSRVIRFHRHGGPEVLLIEEAELPLPGRGEIRIQVKALGLNRAEALLRKGSYIETPGLPSGLGLEAAGVVESMGAGVDGFSLGDASEPAVAEEEPMELSQVAATYDDTVDELVLDAPEAPAEYRPSPAAEVPAESPARSVGGGTLFERMSRLSRGASAPESEDGKEDGVDIPRFLGRQNNQ